jgi:hypothetical protein
MPSSFFSRTRSAVCSIQRALFTWKGTSETMMAVLPDFISSNSALPRTMSEPRPVS